ncbi:MAG: DnaD domain protein [Clostridia bacterium]|nr:DnaD domain protein [Clostridia bacterium]
MSLCKYSTEYVANNSVKLDNIFINDYMIYAPDSYLKVYIYGLFKCGDSASYDNTFEYFCKNLNMSEEEVQNAFLYWQEKGLIQILQTEPIEVRFMPTKNAINGIKKYNTKKYESFNIQIQEIIEGRMITPVEYSEYYYLIEDKHIEKEALILIIKYCTTIKGNNVGYSYICTVARNWANEGITTLEQVEDRLKTFEENNTYLKEILKAIGKKRNPFIEEKEMYNTWKNEMGFDDDVILQVAKLSKKSSSSSFEKIDDKLNKYFEMKLFSIREIMEYEENKQELYSIAKNINKKIGVFYENLENIVETYIEKWISLGYSKEVLFELADYCFKCSIRSLEGMNKVIAKFYKLGVISQNSLHEYFSSVIQEDKQIKLVLEKMNLTRNVNSFDREKYKVWKENWNMSDELISYGAELSKDKISPMQYLSRILSSWNENKITTIEQAKNSNLQFSENLPKENFKGRSYSKEEMNSLFQSIDEVEI